MDNNYIAISAFYTHIQRMRHHISHTLHISSEIEVAFTSNNTHGGPQRLLPNYELSRFNVPRAHIGTLIVAFRRPQRTEQVHERVSNVFSPPKIRADVGRMEPGQWPYLTFYPTGMLQEQHEMAFPVMTMEMTMEQVDEPMDETTANQQPSTSNEPTTIEVRAGRPHEIMNVLSQIMSNPQIRPPSSSSSSGDSQSTSHTTTSTQPEPTVIPPPQSRRGIRERIGNIIPYFRQQSQREQDIPRSSDSTAATAGSATPSSTDSNPSSSPVQPSLPREMRGDAATLLRESQLISRLLAEPRRQQDMRTSRGPETESLAPFPQTVSPTELHNIAQNIASRYRDDAITRIATNLTAAFQEQAPAWDTRLTSIPLRTQRFMLALVLELLTMSARNLEESREMMLALVRDESILIRAIIESMKSLFLLGEFPTHVGRIILQQHSTVGQRVDYESRDGSDSDDTDDMVVRMPSDVSQPRSGSLRDIANARARRRQIVESRRNTSVDPARQAFSASALPVGPSLRAFDQAQVEAGFLPTGPIRQPSASSSSSTDRASVRVAQLRAMLEDTDEMFRDDFARMQEQLAQTQQRIASRLFSAQSNNSDQNPSTSGTNNIGAMTRVHRQTVSIDPFLSCHNRHSDFNRAHNLGSTGSEGDRMTNQSNEPNPNYNHYVSRLDIPQRDTDSVVDDEDFTYEITRNASGELQIQNTEDGRLQFQRIMQTAFRSLFGQLVESDAIMALNSVNLNGFPAPRNEVVQEMLERHPFMVAAAAQSASDNLIAPEILQRPRSAGGNVQNSENDASRRLPRQFFDPTAAISSSLPNISNLSDVVFQAGGLAPRNMRAPAEFDISYPIPTATEVASDALSGLHTFLQSHVGSFPRGLFGLLCELLRNRIGRNDLGGLINQEIATRVIGSMQNVFRQHLIDNQMNGNTRPSRDDIQSVAERLAAEESFFNCYNLSSTNGNGLPINIRGRIYSFGWTFRQLEIDTIRRLLELVLKKTEKDEFVKSVIDIIRQHLQRMLSVFYWFYEGNYENMRQSIIHSFPVWIRTLRSTRDDPETVQMVAASNRIVQTWFDLFSEESTNEVAQFFERLQNQSTLSNLRTSCSNKSNSNSPSSSPSTRERCGDVEEAGESSAKRRKCDEEMEVDVGEEVMEDYDGTEDDNNKPTNSNDSTKK
ncbi:unnamed protein product [Caenorhabditis angaria]|uniref:Uncharacterized protein n=1 Tax=Caenorhabditis angaria TaxID=860376 RepID=A0A9P1N2V6_9PELO|nr:unnamed protein product [Caenorhabditis angaria]